MLEKILLFIVIFFLINISYNLIYNYEELFNIKSIISFFIPIIYLFLFFPFLYFLRLYVLYEDLFLKLKLRNWDRVDKYLYYIKIKIFKYCKFNLFKLNSFMKNKNFFIEKKEDINTIIYNFEKNINKTQELAKDFKKVCKKALIGISKENKIDLFNEWNLILDFLNANKWESLNVIRIESENLIVWYINLVTDSFLTERFQVFLNFIKKLKKDNILPENYYHLYPWENSMNAKDIVFFIYLYINWEKSINKKINLYKKDIDENLKAISEVFWY